MQQRNKIRFIFIAALIGIISLVSLIPHTYVKSQSTWSETLDFTISSHGFSGELGSVWESGSGWGSDSEVENDLGAIVIRSPNFNESTITSIEFTISQNLSGGDLCYAIAEIGDRANPTPAASCSDTTFPFSFASVLGTYFYLYTDISAGPVAPHYTGYIQSVTIEGEGDNPFTGGTQPAISNLGSCPFMQNSNAMFSAGHSWSFENGSTNPDGQDHGLYLPPGSSATLGMVMSKYKPYGVIIKSSLDDIVEDDNEVILFKLGKTELFFPVTEPTFTFEIDPANYEPDLTQGSLDYYFLTLSNDEDTPEGTKLIIDYICIDDPSSNVGSGAGESSVTTCRQCLYEGTGNIINDLLQALQWLWCAIGQLWDCTIKQLFLGIWKAIIKIVEAIAFARNWLGLFFDNGGVWLGAVVSQGSGFFAGFITNVIQAGFNALSNVFNALGLGHVVNTILHFISNIPQSIANLVASLPGAFQFVTDLWSLFTYWIGRLFETLMYAVGTVPIIIQSIFDGFNAAGNEVPVYAPVCNSSNHVLFGPCLGLYVLDYTVFDGPIFYVFIVVLGFVSVNTLLWSLSYIREGLSK